MAKVELKKPIIEEIQSSIKDAKSVVVVDYRGLTVEQDTRLRKSLRENNVTYKVYKNTMINFAIKGTEFESLAPILKDLRQSLFPQKMQQHLQEQSANSQKRLPSLRLRQAL